MIRALLLLLALAVPAAARTARVLSGEHGDFTRLVIELPGPFGWTLGRTETGYGFATRTAEQPQYDLTAVWQRIPRTRLDRIAADPERGSLALGLACDCHVFPFEFGPGIVVLDIKPGPAPEASVFEAPFAAPANAAVAGMPGPAAYDWLAGRDAEADPVPAANLPLPLATGVVTLEPLRNELLEQIARGAADGVVDMRLPGKPGQAEGGGHLPLPWSNVRIGEMPGIAVSGAQEAGGPSNPACADPAQLDLPSWGAELTPASLLAETRAGLYGEFDAPDPDAIRQAVRRLLFLGFGAEARQTARLIGDAPSDPELELLRSMTWLVDGQSDPRTPFAAMLDCDGPAALWAALAHDRLPPGPGVNRDAILQAFLALPPHLRRHLGPALAEAFLARGDAEATRLIRDAVERAPEADPATIALIDAAAELRQGDPEAAQRHAETAVALEGNRAAGLVALVEAHVRTLDPLGPDTVEALLALQGETEGTPEGGAVARAVVLAYALSGQTAAAFLDPGATGRVRADLWRVAADRATDDDFLRQAVLPATETAPDVSAETGLAVSERLIGLGFPEAARVWLGPVTGGDPPERRRLAARAALGIGDASGSIALIQGLDDAESQSLRAEAMLRLGDLPAAERALAATGDAGAAARLGLWRGNWSGLDPSLPQPWQALATILAAAPAGNASGPLGRGAEAVKATIASRAAIEALLASVAGAPSG